MARGKPTPPPPPLPAPLRAPGRSAAPRNRKLGGGGGGGGGRGTGTNSATTSQQDAKPLLSGWAMLSAHEALPERVYLVAWSCIGMAAFKEEVPRHGQAAVLTSPSSEGYLDRTWLFGGRLVCSDVAELDASPATAYHPRDVDEERSVRTMRSFRSRASSARSLHGESTLALQTYHPRKGQNTTLLHFRSQKERQRWVQAIQKARMCHTYIVACCQLGLQPLNAILAVLLGSEESLRVKDQGLGPGALQTLVSISPVLDAIAQPIHTFNLVSLELVRAGLSPRDAEGVAVVLQRCPRLRVLNISGNKLGDEGCMAIQWAMASGTQPLRHLRELHMSSVGLTNAGAEGIAVVIKALESGLEVLCLDGNRLTRVGGSSIANALMNNLTVRQRLKVLDLSFNHIGDVVAGLVAQLLLKATHDPYGAKGIPPPEPGSLQELRLGHCMIGNDGHRALHATMVSWVRARAKVLQATTAHHAWLPLHTVDLVGNLASGDVTALLVSAASELQGLGARVKVTVGGAETGWGLIGSQGLFGGEMRPGRKLIGAQSMINRLVLRRRPLIGGGEGLSSQGRGSAASTAPSDVSELAGGDVATGGGALGGKEGVSMVLHIDDERQQLRRKQRPHSAENSTLYYQGRWMVAFQSLVRAPLSTIRLESSYQAKDGTYISLRVATSVMVERVTTLTTEAPEELSALGIRSIFVAPNETQPAISALGQRYSETRLQSDVKELRSALQGTEAKVAQGLHIVPPVFRLLKPRRIAPARRPDDISRAKARVRELTYECTRKELLASLTILRCTVSHLPTAEELAAVRARANAVHVEAAMRSLGIQDVASHLATLLDGATKEAEMARSLQEALYKRDRQSIESCLQGDLLRTSVTYAPLCVLAMKVLADIQWIQDEGCVLPVISDPAAIEAFLLRCARAGYEGYETMYGVQQLQACTAEEKRQGRCTENDEWWIQCRSWLCNTLLKRELPALAEAQRYMRDLMKTMPQERLVDEHLAVDEFVSLADVLVQFAASSSSASSTPLASASANGGAESRGDVRMDVSSLAFQLVAAVKYKGVALSQLTRDLSQAEAQVTTVVDAMQHALLARNPTLLCNMYRKAVELGCETSPVVAFAGRVVRKAASEERLDALVDRLDKFVELVRTTDEPNTAVLRPIARCLAAVRCLDPSSCEARRAGREKSIEDATRAFNDLLDSTERGSTRVEQLWALRVLVNGDASDIRDFLGMPPSANFTTPNFPSAPSAGPGVAILLGFFSEQERERASLALQRHVQWFLNGDAEAPSPVATASAESSSVFLVWRPRASAPGTPPTSWEPWQARCETGALIIVPSSGVGDALGGNPSDADSHAETYRLAGGRLSHRPGTTAAGPVALLEVEPGAETRTDLEAEFVAPLMQMLAALEKQRAEKDLAAMEAAGGLPVLSELQAAYAKVSVVDDSASVRELMHAEGRAILDTILAASSTPPSLSRSHGVGVGEDPGDGVADSSPLSDLESHSAFLRDAMARHRVVALRRLYDSLLARNLDKLEDTLRLPVLSEVSQKHPLVAKARQVAAMEPEEAAVERFEHMVIHRFQGEVSRARLAARRLAFTPHQKRWFCVTDIKHCAMGALQDITTNVTATKAAHKQLEAVKHRSLRMGIEEACLTCTTKWLERTIRAETIPSRNSSVDPSPCVLLTSQFARPQAEFVTAAHYMQARAGNFPVHLSWAQEPAEKPLSKVQNLTEAEEEHFEQDSADLFNHVVTVTRSNPRAPPPPKMIQSALTQVIQTVMEQPELEIEAYFQVVKQLTLNPHLSNRKHGWMLLALLAHLAPLGADPGTHILAHIEETLFAVESKVGGLGQDYGISLPSHDAEKGALAVLTDGSISLALAAHCLEVMRSTLLSAGHREQGTVDRAKLPTLTTKVVSNSKVDISVTLPSGVPTTYTGSTGHRNTPQSVLAALFTWERLNAREGRGEGGASIAAWPISPELLMDVEWSGFRLCRVTAEPGAACQPVPVAEDVVWSRAIADCMVEVDGPDTGRAAQYEVRRVTGSRNEGFAEYLEPLVTLAPGYGDPLKRTQLWREWLTWHGDGTSMLPYDARRVAGLYAQESRAVQEGLYLGTVLPLAYLLALQVSIQVPSAQKRMELSEESLKAVDGVHVLKEQQGCEAFRYFLQQIADAQQQKEDSTANGSAASVVPSRFQYLLQRCYVSYLQMWELYGCVSIGSLEVSSPILPDGFPSSSVLGRVNVDGVWLLSHDADPTLVGFVDLGDVCEVVPGTPEAGNPGAKAPVCLKLKQGVDVTFLVPGADVTGVCEVLTFTSSHRLTLFDAAGRDFDVAEMLRAFLREFPILPRPPPPPVLRQSSPGASFFDSRRVEPVPSRASAPGRGSTELAIDRLSLEDLWTNDDEQAATGARGGPAAREPRLAAIGRGRRTRISAVAEEEPGSDDGGWSKADQRGTLLALPLLPELDAFASAPAAGSSVVDADSAVIGVSKSRPRFTLNSVPVLELTGPAGSSRIFSVAGGSESDDGTGGAFLGPPRIASITARLNAKKEEGSSGKGAAPLLGEFENDGGGGEEMRQAPAATALSEDVDDKDDELALGGLKLYWWRDEAPRWERPKSEWGVSWQGSAYLRRATVVEAGAAASAAATGPRARDVGAAAAGRGRGRGSPGGRRGGRGGVLPSRASDGGRGGLGPGLRPGGRGPPRPGPSIGMAARPRPGPRPARPVPQPRGGAPVAAPRGRELGPRGGRGPGPGGPSPSPARGPGPKKGAGAVRGGRGGRARGGGRGL